MTRARERQVQAAIVQALRLKGHLVLATNIEVPMGGRAGMLAAMARKAMGVVPGTPDIAVCLPDARVLWLEVKLPSIKTAPADTPVRCRSATKTSKTQDALHALMRDRGHRVVVVRGVEEAIQALEAA